MLQIELDNLWFHAHHGLYEEEKVLGGDFVLEVKLQYLPEKTPQQIHEVIDYSSVYALITKHMAKPEPLLETLVMNIAEDILRTFPLAQEISVSLKKIKPPIIGFRGSVQVSYKTKRIL